MSKEITMRMPDGQRSSITVTQNNGAIDLVFLRPGCPTTGVRLPMPIARLLIDALQAETGAANV